MRTREVWIPCPRFGETVGWPQIRRIVADFVELPRPLHEPIPKHLGRFRREPEPGLEVLQHLAAHCSIKRFAGQIDLLQVFGSDVYALREPRSRHPITHVRDELG